MTDRRKSLGFFFPFASATPSLMLLLLILRKENLLGDDNKRFRYLEKIYFSDLFDCKSATAIDFLWCLNIPQDFGFIACIAAL